LNIDEMAVFPFLFNALIAIMVSLY
jgi:hypothetical protein